MSVRITTFQGEVVYDGPGRVRMGSEARSLAAPGRNPVVVETRRPDGRCFRADLTELLEHVHFDWVADYRGFETLMPDWTLRVDLSASHVRWLRDSLTLTADEQAAQAEAERAVQDAVAADLRRIRGALAGAYGIAEEWLTDPEPQSVARYDDLINSTRAEFVPDPHNYTTPRTNAMSWSPPADGEKVPRCP